MELRSPMDPLVYTSHTLKAAVQEWKSKHMPGKEPVLTGFVNVIHSCMPYLYLLDPGRWIDYMQLEHFRATTHHNPAHIRAKTTDDVVNVIFTWLCAFRSAGYMWHFLPNGACHLDGDAGGHIGAGTSIDTTQLGRYELTHRVADDAYWYCRDLFFTLSNTVKVLVCLIVECRKMVYVPQSFVARVVHTDTANYEAMKRVSAFQRGARLVHMMILGPNGVKGVTAMYNWIELVKNHSNFVTSIGVWFKYIRKHLVHKPRAPGDDGSLVNVLSLAAMLTARFREVVEASYEGIQQIPQCTARLYCLQSIASFINIGLFKTGQHPQLNASWTTLINNLSAHSTTYDDIETDFYELLHDTAIYFYSTDFVWAISDITRPVLETPPIRVAVPFASSNTARPATGTPRPARRAVPPSYERAFTPPPAYVRE